MYWVAKGNKKGFTLILVVPIPYQSEDSHHLLHLLTIIHIICTYIWSTSLQTFIVLKPFYYIYFDSKIKVVRSDRENEYYGRHSNIRQATGPFYNFCKEQGITDQYTMPGSPQHNSVAKRINRTLIDMVRSMIANTHLPTYFWTKALKTTVHILNRFHQNLSLTLFMRSG